MVEAASDKGIPFPILTGFLGAGKTTLLNHSSHQPEMKDTAVLIKEFGEVGVDHLLVEKVDDSVRGGDQDLIFPHHENEIAQDEAANGGQYCRYWRHNGYVTVGGEKMSRSLGNFRILCELFRHCPGEVIRYALPAGDYRNPLDFSLAALEGLLQQPPDKWRQRVMRMDDAPDEVRIAALIAARGGSEQPRFRAGGCLAAGIGGAGRGHRGRPRATWHRSRPALSSCRIASEP